MQHFSPKSYQQEAFDTIELYFRNCHTYDSPSIAYNVVSEEISGRNVAYRSLPGFPKEMPFFCLRIPTGGGKTWMAAKSIQIVNRHLLRTEHSVILWLVPSDQIREQTLKGLKDRDHPLFSAICEAGPVTVLNLDEAKTVSRATLDTSTTVIVATRQAFQVGDEKSRKVYDSNGALMHHFENLNPAAKKDLLQDGEITPYSLANVLRLRRPFVIVDEAHNSRTALAFETLAKFRPSGVMELTATPDTTRTPSNVLHSVSAAELKSEEMIKLPIKLATEPKWQQCLADAISRRDELQAISDKERRAGEAYLRPIALIQTQPRRTGVETLDVERVYQELIENHRIPKDEIVIATGSEKGLEKIDAEFDSGISDPDCPVKFVITQRALAEGWDCPSAYVLASMAELQSSTAVEQLLGRILRQPDARHRESQELNQSYAFVVSRNFADTASALRDKLVAGAGFEHKDIQDFVQALDPKMLKFDLEALHSRAEVRPVIVQLPEAPQLGGISQQLKQKIDWDSKEKSLTIKSPLTPEEKDELKTTVEGERAQEAIDLAAKASEEAIEFVQYPAEQGEVVRIPQLAVMVQGRLQIFDDPEVLDYPWDVSSDDAVPSDEAVSLLHSAQKVAGGGSIDITEEGKVGIFMENLQRSLDIVYRPEHWDEVKLAAWLCKNIPEPTLTHTSKMSFVNGWLNTLQDKHGFDLARINQQKFLIRNLIEKHILELRETAANKAFQLTLFGDDARKRVSVDKSYNYVFDPQGYTPNSYYDPNGKWGYYDFKKHFYRLIGDFDSQEEFKCAVWLDQQAQQGRIKYWIRNLVRKPGCSMFLQKAPGRFYPDFVCVLPDNSILIVEYKSSRDWDNPKVVENRKLGDLWAELSNGKCHFVMVKDLHWDWIEEKIREVL